MTVIGDSGGWSRQHVGCGQKDNVERDHAGVRGVGMGIIAHCICSPQNKTHHVIVCQQLS